MALMTYTAVDGYSISSGSVIATLMADTASEMVTDRIGNSPLKTLTANGSITTSAVASNSSTLAASGFSAANYYSLAYDSALDPGTSGLSIKIWFKSPGVSTVETFISRMASTSPIGPYYVMQLTNTGKAAMYINDGSLTRSCTTDSDYDDDTWHQFIALITSTYIYNYIDGDLVKTSTFAALNSLSNASAVLNKLRVLP